MILFKRWKKSESVSDLNQAYQAETCHAWNWTHLAYAPAWIGINTYLGYNCRTFGRICPFCGKKYHKGHRASTPPPPTNQCQGEGDLSNSFSPQIFIHFVAKGDDRMRSTILTVFFSFLSSRNPRQVCPQKHVCVCVCVCLSVCLSLDVVCVSRIKAWLVGTSVFYPYTFFFIRTQNLNLSLGVLKLFTVFRLKRS